MRDDKYDHYERNVYRAAKLATYFAYHGEHEKARVIMQMGAELPKEGQEDY
jgi:hypothetical protein